MKEHELFLLKKNITVLDAKDGINERISKIQAITNYILADAANGKINVDVDTLINAVWAVESFVQEIEILQTVR
jgi:hypothetical protein